MMNSTSAQLNDIINWMESMADENQVKELRRFGITARKAYGISMPTLMAKAKQLGRNHKLAMKLWQSGINDARLLATMIADPGQITPELMDKLVEDFDSWDICDQTCMKLFRTTPYVNDKIYQWAPRREEFIRRAAFALIAQTAISDKKSPHDYFLPYLDLIVEYSTDPRNFVKKAVTWALRQIGKRHVSLHGAALKVAFGLAESGDATARWIGRDAIRDLQSPTALRRLERNSR